MADQSDIVNRIKLIEDEIDRISALPLEDAIKLADHIRSLMYELEALAKRLGKTKQG